MKFQAFSINAASTKVVGGAASANVAMPVTADGKNPRYVRVATDGNCYVQAVPTNAGTVSAANGILVTPYESLNLEVRGNDFIAYIQSAAAPNITISPIET